MTNGIHSMSAMVPEPSIALGPISSTLNPTQSVLTPVGHCLMVDVRSTSDRVSSSSPSAFPILNLPPELRLVIYSAILLNPSANNNNDLSLLQTNQQINMEASEILYQRSTSFPSQAKLFAWIDRSRIANLNRVRTLTLRLTDVDLSTLLLDQPSTKRHTRTGAWSLYKCELERLEQSLSALPNLTNLTVVPPKIGRSTLLRNMYLSFLAEIPKRCPRLKRLEVHDSEDLLTIVPALKEVMKGVFSATSTAADSGVVVKEERRETESWTERGSTDVATKLPKRSSWARTVLG